MVYTGQWVSDTNFFLDLIHTARERVEMFDMIIDNIGDVTQTTAQHAQPVESLGFIRDDFELPVEENTAPSANEADFDETAIHDYEHYLADELPVEQYAAPSANEADSLEYTLHNYEHYFADESPVEPSANELDLEEIAIHEYERILPAELFVEEATQTSNHPEQSSTESDSESSTDEESDDEEDDTFLPLQCNRMWAVCAWLKQCPDEYEEMPNQPGTTDCELYLIERKRMREDGPDDEEQPQEKKTRSEPWVRKLF